MQLILVMGFLWYKGIRENLQNLSEEYFLTHENIEIDINIDGLPIFDCSCCELVSLYPKVIKACSLPINCLSQVTPVVRH